MAYDNSSRIKPERPHQWFMDGVEAEIFPNKKQAIEGPHPNSFSGFLNSNVSPWGNATSFHSDENQFTESVFDPEIANTISFGDRNDPSVATGNMNMERKVIEDSIGSDFSFGLSISHSPEDPRLELNYGGIRKVKVSQVKDAENYIPVSVGHTYDREDNSMIYAPHAFGKTDDNTVSIGFSFNGGDSNTISMGHTLTREVNNLLSLSKHHNKSDNCETVMGLVCRENGGSISLSESPNKDQCAIASLAQTSKNADGNPVAGGHSVNMDSTVVSIALPFSMDDSNILPVGQTFNKGATVAASMDHYFHKVDDNSMPISNSYSKIDDNNLSMGHSFTKGQSKIISFGGFGDNDDLNASEKLIGSYDLLMGQSSVQKSKTVGLKASGESNPDALAKVFQITSSSEIILKKKEDQKVTKKPPPNNFPSNVRSLLSTGILDGVPVKYIAWSREKELRGIIKGAAYLCGCQSCNYSKAINAYEFERHAGCKTKHPNNHIYFETGKTIYGIVQELRNTPQNLLFEVIQTITGSPINQKSFRLWKESFLAATRELQRIYGKDEGMQFS